jgi:choline kinase/thiamine kinase-like enzyme/mannose-6-phosphate isomerase-like protein (cupin superfamily)
MNKIVHKPWGKEEWLELNEFYCYKRIYIKSGHKTSYQYHNQKHETNYIISGTAEIWLEDDNGIVHKKIMTAGEYFNVSPPKKHRVIALTDLILQEVSTPHVDDVIRIEDDTNRPDGKIITEHLTPAVLILCAGLGTRLQNISKSTNKVLVPINNKAVISHIIEKFPTEYDIVVAVGHKGDVVKEYCKLAHPERNITFVDVDDYTSSKSGPGYSALQCKHLLQRPFYFITGDCLLESDVPSLIDNWIGVTNTEFPEKYSTACVKDGNVIEFKNKSVSGFDNAFIGVAGIKDYEIFWNNLENMIQDTGEIVNAFLNITDYPVLKAKTLSWFDTGNLDDLMKAQKFFNDVPLSLSKDLGEITYKVHNKFLKYFPDTTKLENLKKRNLKLQEMTPPDITFGNHFLSYSWITGDTLYNVKDEKIFESFLNTLNSLMGESKISSPEHSKVFYIEKTNKRVQLFIEKYGEHYFNNAFSINGTTYSAMKDVYGTIDFSILENNPLYSKFHGDLQFDNILYDGKKFFYIDWREEYGGNTDVGDVYYDLAKMMGGLIISYNKMKDETNIVYLESTSEVITYPNFENAHKDNLDRYIVWLEENNFDVNKVKLIVALIFLNMSPLHEEKFSKFLWFKSLTLLYDYYNK